MHTKAKYIKLKKYIKPAISAKIIPLNFFTNPDFLGNNLLAICYYCIGDTCPPDCSTTCFLKGTHILTVKGHKKIEEINKEQDVVISYDFQNKKLTRNEVKEVIIHNNVSSYLIINKHIRVTPEHRFWANNVEWKKAAELKNGDYLLNSSLEKVIIYSIEHVNEIVRVYNLELKGGPHNYFAEDVLVHNWK